MAKAEVKKKADKKLKGGTGEQGKLIDTNPENLKPFMKKARQYRATVSERLAIQQSEAEQKAELRELVAAAGLQPLPNGDILFKYEDVTITLEAPKEGKLTVKVEEDE
jgi:hypothetical protein